MTVVFHHKKTSLIAILFILLYTTVRAQLVVNGTVAVKINGGSSTTPAYLVLNNPPTAPIKTVGTTGGIMMESEYNITQYNLKTATTSINVPYLTYAMEQMPLAVTGLSAGTETASGTGSIRFSTKTPGTVGTARASGWDNANYMPSDVNNMNGYNGGVFTADNSANVIDRFWIIDANGYTTSPGAIYSFGYINAEGSANGGNTLTISSLQAMAFDKGATTWGNYGPTGTNTTGGSSGSVNSVSIGAGKMGNIFRSWTLVSNLNVLPVNLLTFSGNCYGNINATIEWSTVQENNSSYFTIEKSTDGQNYRWLANVNASGNSTQKKTYSYVDVNDIDDNTYYRLSETDLNGNKSTFNSIMISRCEENMKENMDAYTSTGNITLTVYSLSTQAIPVSLFDVTGRLIYKTTVNATEGSNKFLIKPGVSNGIYIIQAESNITSLIKRVPIVN